MKAIIVPSLTDLNKGDQALVWESYRLVQDTELFKDIYVLSKGHTKEEREELYSQSLKKGFNMVENILPHPRREKNEQSEYVKESKITLIRQIFNASLDFIQTKALLGVCNNILLVKKIFPNRVFKTIQRFTEADVIFVKGGGFIHAYGETSAPYLMWYFLFYIRLAKRLKKKVIFLPNSYGPFEGFTVKKQVRSVFKGLDLIYAREQVSGKSLEKLLEREVPVEMDLGFFLEKGSQGKALDILDKYEIQPNEKVVGITIRPWRFPGHSNREVLYEKYINSVVLLIRHVINLEYKVALCNQSLGPNAHEDDRNAIRDLMLKIDSKNLIWINEDLDCQTLKAVYSNFYFFVGTRFHSIIFSLTSHVPSIAIGYGGNKAKGIMKDFNLDNYVIPIHNINPDTLIRMFNEGIENYDQIKEGLMLSTQLVKESRERIIRGIQNIIC